MPDAHANVTLNPAFGTSRVNKSVDKRKPKESSSVCKNLGGVESRLVPRTITTTHERSASRADLTDDPTQEITGCYRLLCLSITFTAFFYFFLTPPTPSIQPPEQKSQFSWTNQTRWHLLMIYNKITMQHFFLIHLKITSNQSVVKR